MTAPHAHHRQPRLARETASARPDKRDMAKVRDFASWIRAELDAMPR